MKAIGFSFLFIILLVVVGAIGLFALQPGLTLVALCALPLATLGLGWALGRSRVRLSLSADGF